jgi:hypothetical protein
MQGSHRWHVSVHVLGLRLDFTMRPWTGVRWFGRPQLT